MSTRNIKRNEPDALQESILELFMSKESTLENLVESKPLEVYLRYEEDISQAYRAYYKDQVVNDKRNELGRFLFGVSFTTIGLFTSIIKFSPNIGNIDNYNFIYFIISGIVLICSALFSLKLAVPKNQKVDPTKLELIEFHSRNSKELSFFSLLWFILWLIGLIISLIGLFI